MALHLRSFIAATAASLLLLSSPVANAGSTAFASITDVRLGVLDLTPDDDAAAGYDILSIVPSLFASVYTGTAEYYAAGYPGALTPAVVQLGLGGSTMSAGTDGTLANVTASASGDASLGSYGSAGGSANQAVQIVLRPHTVLTIGGHLSTVAVRSTTPDEYLEAVGMAYVGIVDDNGYTFTQFIRQSLSYADWPERMTVEDDFMLAFANGSAQDRTMSVYFQAMSNVMRIATPVPEPSAAMLLCAGLLLTGLRAAVARRS